MIKMRVKEGRAPLPYNDGTGSKVYQPGEVFDGTPELLAATQLHGWVEAIDEQGNVIDQGALPMTADVQDAFRRARPHERVSMLQEFKQRREEAHKRELAEIDAQVARNEQEALKESEEKNRRVKEGHAHVYEAPAVDQPINVPAPAKPAKPASEPVDRKGQ